MIHMLFYPVALMQLTTKSGTNWIDGLPFIIILIVIPPILVFVHIIRQPERLRNAKVLETWGFVYIGFRQNRIFLFLLLDFATMVMFVATRYIYPYNLDLSALTEAIANQKARMFANFCILWVTTLLHKHFKPFVSERMNKDTTGLHKALSTMYVVSFACLSTDLATCNGATLAVGGVMYWLCNFFVAIFYPLYYLGDYYFYGAFSRRRMKFRQSLKVTEIVDARAIGDVDDDVQIESDSLIVFRGEEDIKRGGGGGGNVFVDTLDGHKVAVKELINMDAIGVEEMNAEVRNMKQARHPAIIYLYGTCFVPSRSNLGIDHHYIVMELADRGSLEGCLLEQKQLRKAEYEKNPQHFSDYQDAMARSDFPLTVMNVLNWARDIVSGFHFLYLKGIAHRDIKPDNIFLAKDYSAKIGDLGFGMKKKEGLTDSMPTVLRRTSSRNEDSRRDTEVDGGVGTLPYMAPEAFQKTLDRDDLEKADVWSFGVMLARICTLEEPFNPSINHRALRGQIRDGVPRGTLRPFEYLGDRMFFPPATPANLEKYYVHEGLLPIIKECLNHNPDSRPSFKNLKDILTKIHEQAHHTIQQAKSDLVEVALEDTPIMAQKSSTTSTALGQSSSSLRTFSFIELISGESSRKNGAEEPLMP
jgi:serine/threonine protein kinase